VWRRRRTVSHDALEALAGRIVMDRPTTPSLWQILDGFNVARLDTLEHTPAAMVLDRMGVKTADDLLNLLRIVSIDAALATASFATLEAVNDPALALQSTLAAIRVTLRDTEL
jgi:hypothetical protein